MFPVSFGEKLFTIPMHIFVSLLYAKVCCHIVSAQYSAVSIAVEFVMWMSAVVQVWFSLSQRSRCCIVAGRRTSRMGYLCIPSDASGLLPVRNQCVICSGFSMCPF